MIEAQEGPSITERVIGAERRPNEKEPAMQRLWKRQCNTVGRSTKVRSVRLG